MEALPLVDCGVCGGDYELVDAVESDDGPPGERGGEHHVGGCGGRGYNVIPSKTVLRGTIQALRDHAMLVLKEGLVHIADDTAEAHGCEFRSFRGIRKCRANETCSTTWFGK